MDLAENIPGFTKTDRLGLTAFVSVLIHMTIILGISFTVPDVRSNEPLPTLDITLVNTRTDKPPEDADFLAQANQQGGGDTDKAVIASSPVPFTPARAASRQVPRSELKTTSREPKREVDKLLTQNRERTKTVDNRTPQERQAASQPDTKPGLASANKLARERARLTTEISAFWQEYQKRPRRKFISARTKEYKYAEYMEAWRNRVERVGNLNYPQKARQENLTGNLVLDVAINPNGSVHSVNLIRSSGSKVLDDAARRIVELAAPYQPFSPEIRKDVDILHITRTWQFMHGNRLVSR